MILRCLLIASMASFSVAMATPIDINQVDAKVLAKTVKGIGPTRAQAIIDYRDKHGNFSKLDDLVQVRGISRAFIDKNHQQLQQNLQFTDNKS